MFSLFSFLSSLTTIYRTCFKLVTFKPATVVRDGAILLALTRMLHLRRSLTHLSIKRPISFKEIAVFFVLSFSTSGGAGTSILDGVTKKLLWTGILDLPSQLPPDVKPESLPRA